jgi:hypothetical protein
MREHDAASAFSSPVGLVGNRSFAWRESHEGRDRVRRGSVDHDAVYSESLTLGAESADGRFALCQGECS